MPRLILGEKRPKSWYLHLSADQVSQYSNIKDHPEKPPIHCYPQKEPGPCPQKGLHSFFIPFYINMVIKGMWFNYGVRTALHITWAKPLEVDLLYLIRLRNTKWAFLMSINLPSFHLDSAVTNLFQSYKMTAAETKAHSYLWQFQKEKLHNIKTIETNKFYLKLMSLKIFSKWMRISILLNMFLKSNVTTI